MDDIRYKFLHDKFMSNMKEPFTGDEFKDWQDLNMEKILDMMLEPFNLGVLNRLKDR